MLPLQVSFEIRAVSGSIEHSGLIFAAHGTQTVAFIAIAAWSALAVRLSRNHLKGLPHR